MNNPKLMGAALVGALTGLVYSLSSAPDHPHYSDEFRVKGTVVEKVEAPRGAYPNGSPRDMRDFLIRPLPGEYEFEGRTYAFSPERYYHVGTGDETRWSEIAEGDTVELIGKLNVACNEYRIFQSLLDKHGHKNGLEGMFDRVVPENSNRVSVSRIVDDVVWVQHMHKDPQPVEAPLYAKQVAK
ncbi:hypothetical protein HYW21_09075 [Candidatus Woesearchaeota archaeon]|nr:hypothetical protein [Candidatus Woesearchaeota archaeon]